MDDPAVDPTLCERCNLLAFDDLAAGCRVVTDEKGVARLLFDDSKFEWRYDDPRDSRDSERNGKLIRLRWHLDDSLPYLPQLSNSSQSGCKFCDSLFVYLGGNQSNGAQLDNYSIQDGPVSLTAYVSLSEEGIDGLVVELVSNRTESEENSVRVFFPIEASPSEYIHLFLVRTRLTLSSKVATSGLGPSLLALIAI